MKRTICYIATFAGMVLLLAACSTQSRLEMDYGTSYKLAIMNQTLDPKAEKNLEPVYGMDGQSSQKVMDKYGKEFEKAAPPPSYIINLGGGGK